MSKSKPYTPEERDTIERARRELRVWLDVVSRLRDEGMLPPGSTLERRAPGNVLDRYVAVPA